MSACVVWLSIVCAASPMEHPGKAVDDESLRLRRKRVEQHERENAVEYAGRYRLMLPRGFQYDVELTQRDDGLLRLDGKRRLLLFGDFAWWKGELLLVEPRSENVRDFVWERLDDGVLVLRREDHRHGAHYVGARLVPRR